MMNTDKPLGQKSYGSIPHLPGSRRGPADRGVNEGQLRIATEQTRDKHDIVIVEEKLDGSNVAVANVDGNILAITRSGYLATTSPYEQHHLFAKYVEINEGRFKELLDTGERVCGEWLAMAHGTRYNLLGREPFVAFDLMRGNRRATTEERMDRLPHMGFAMPPQFHYSAGKPLSIENALKEIEKGGFYGALDSVEGAVWRVERKGEVDFLCKYVAHEKQDGKYFGDEPVWNIDPKQFR